MTEVAIPALLCVIMIVMTRWQLGLIMVVVVGILQDPLRKMTLNQPLYFTLGAAVVFAAACWGATMARVQMMPCAIFGWGPRLRRPFAVLLLTIGLQSVHSYVRFGNPMLTGLGLLTYLLPIPAFLFAHQLAVRGGLPRVLFFFRFYAVLIGLTLLTVYVEYAGFQSAALGEVGVGIPMYGGPLGIMRANAGLFRAAEIAAWHVATCSCVIILLATIGKASVRNVLMAAGSVAILLGAGLLTARRKLLGELALFAGTYVFLYLVMRRRALKLGIAAAVVGGLLFLAWVRYDGGPLVEENVHYAGYVERGRSALSSAPLRFLNLGLAPLSWAYQGVGFWGAGLGMGTQGGQYFGAIPELSGVAEGGLGKLALELGFPGLGVAGWFFVALGRHIWRILRFATKRSWRHAQLSYGLVSLLTANLAAFSIATQAFGDMVILLILGSCVGFTLAIPALVEQEQAPGLDRGAEAA